MASDQSGTPGGARLRSLRRAAGRTQLWVELEASLGTGYLQRLESGRVVQPERPTIARILDALDARYSERREVMEAFGYLVQTPVPTDEEVEWAIEISHGQLDAAPFPAFVLDCAHRLISWNRYLARLFGGRYVSELERCSFLAPWFDPESPIGASVAEPERLLPALIRAARFEMRDFGDEPWYPDLLAELRKAPLFSRYWSAVEREPPVASAARALVPVRLNVPDAGELAFHLSSERFTRDARFRLVYYFPADLATIRWAADIR